MINGNFETVNGACGVGVVSEFRKQRPIGYTGGFPITKMNPGGAGWLTSGFIHKDETSNEAFKELCEKYKLVFKTRPRKNKNSGNMFYFCVFDTRGSGVSTGFAACYELGW